MWVVEAAPAERAFGDSGVVAMKEPWRTITEITSTLLVLYLATPDANIQVWRGMSRLCQSVAHRFGRWGILAEQHYMNLVN